MTIENFFKEHNKFALAYSGGVDSLLVAALAVKYGCDFGAYTIKTQFQPDFETEEALHYAKRLGFKLKLIKHNVLESAVVASNPSDRCYHCKNVVFSLVKEAAKADGYDMIFDGTNASDDASDRPGMRALEEMKVLSPLKLLNIDKATVRLLLKEMGIEAHSKPSYSCLATRLETGKTITEEVLKKVEVAEVFLMDNGFSDFRVRVLGENAKLELTSKDLELLMQKREVVLNELKKSFKAVYVDLQCR